MTRSAGVVAALRSTSTRNFLVVPLAVFAEQALRRRQVHAGWAVPAACGYLQYRLCGRYRSSRGGGGPGLSNPPVHLVTTGPYALTRNPMYLGHLVFLASLSMATRSPVALAYTSWSVVWFDRRAGEDERRLETMFGEEYRRYCRRVPRWLPVTVRRVDRLSTISSGHNAKPRCT